MPWLRCCYCIPIKFSIIIPLCTISIFYNSVYAICLIQNDSAVCNKNNSCVIAYSRIRSCFLGIPVIGNVNYTIFIKFIYRSTSITCISIISKTLGSKCNILSFWQIKSIKVCATCEHLALKLNIFSSKFGILNTMIGTECCLFFVRSLCIFCRYNQIFRHIVLSEAIPIKFIAISTDGQCLQWVCCNSINIFSDLAIPIHGQFF